jgi:hypothetical protein
MTCVDKVCAETYLTPVSSTVKTKDMIIINPPKIIKLDRSLDNEERSLCLILLPKFKSHASISLTFL